MQKSYTRKTTLDTFVFNFLQSDSQGFLLDCKFNKLLFFIITKHKINLIFASQVQFKYHFLCFLTQLPQNSSEKNLPSIKIFSCFLSQTSEMRLFNTIEIKKI